MAKIRVLLLVLVAWRLFPTPGFSMARKGTAPVEAEISDGFFIIFIFIYIFLSNSL